MRRGAAWSPHSKPQILPPRVRILSPRHECCMSVYDIDPGRSHAHVITSHRARFSGLWADRGRTQLHTPYNLSFHLSCSRGHAAPPGGRAGPTLRDGPMVHTLRRLARSRGPRAACNMVARSLGAAGWPLSRGAASAAVGRCSPDFCSRSCMKVLHRPDVCINRGVRQVPVPRVGKAWRDALREEGEDRP